MIDYKVHHYIILYFIYSKYSYYIFRYKFLLNSKVPSQGIKQFLFYLNKYLIINFFFIN